jgi:hypothetical protein
MLARTARQDETKRSTHSEKFSAEEGPCSEVLGARIELDLVARRNMAAAVAE